MSSSRDKISLEEACAFLECARPKLMELLGEGLIPGIQLGKAWVIPRLAFFQAVNQLALDSAETAREVARLDAAEKRRAEAQANVIPSSFMASVKPRTFRSAC